MDFELKDVLEAVGPTASIIFASWIFMTFLQQRYNTAYDRYRSLINNFRQGLEPGRKQKVQDEIMLYRKRVSYMRSATNLGLYAAILLIIGIECGALDAMFQGGPLFKYLGALAILSGLALVVASAICVVIENKLIREAMNMELEDVHELADQAGRPRAN